MTKHLPRPNRNNRKWGKLRQAFDNHVVSIRTKLPFCSRLALFRSFIATQVFWRWRPNIVQPTCLNNTIYQSYWRNCVGIGCRKNRLGHPTEAMGYLVSVYSAYCCWTTSQSHKCNWKNVLKKCLDLLLNSLQK